VCKDGIVEATARHLHHGLLEFQQAWHLLTLLTLLAGPKEARCGYARGKVEAEKEEVGRGRESTRRRMEEGERREKRGEEGSIGREGGAG
jgi:hypothetical protein